LQYPANNASHEALLPRSFRYSHAEFHFAGQDNLQNNSSLDAAPGSVKFILMLKSKKQKLTDDEYVEKIRRQLNSSRKAGIYIGIGYIVALVLFLIFAQELIEMGQKAYPHSRFYYSGLAAGLITGMILAFLFYRCIKALVDAVMMVAGTHFSQTSRLLVVYYDLARERPHQ
jgi:hypothetical protein